MTSHERSRRYLVEGRLTVETREEGRIRAVCRGLRGVYDLGYERVRGWWCSCTSLEGGPRRCAHVIALQLVTVPHEQGAW